MITDYVKNAVNGGLALLPNNLDTVQARVMIYAIGLQESRFTDRYQRITKPGEKLRKGPARGFWQFEQGGGVSGVMRHPATKDLARTACDVCAIPFNTKDVWESLEYEDELAAAFARLLLYSDPYPLPSVAQTATAWEYYLRTWRPGKPHAKTWGVFHAHAVNAVDRRSSIRKE